MKRYDEFVKKVKAAVLDSAGATSRELRRAVAFGPASEVPDALRGYVDKVARHAYRVSDEDVAGLLKAGYSEDEIFELTGAAALGAALRRLERGMAVLEESGRPQEIGR